MKRNNLKILIIGFTVFLLHNNVKAQFKIDAQYRPRFELRDGYQKLAADSAVPAAFVSQRTRITFGYETDKIKLKFTPQDIRTWGDEQTAGLNGGNGNDASVDLFEGYAEIKIGAENWISVGRQQFIYDNNSLLSNANWNQNGSSADAVIFKLSMSDWNIHIAGSWNALRAESSDIVYPSSRIKTINFLWLNRKFNDQLTSSFLHVASGVTETDTTNTLHFRQTTGLFGSYILKDFKAQGDFYLQYGKNPQDKNIMAFLFDADLSYQVGKLMPGIAVSYLSGNSKTGNELETDNLFDPLYRSRHGYFGSQDYFRDFSSNTKQGGLADYFIYFEYKISDALNIRNAAHYFQLAQTNSTTPDDKNLGFENDLLLKYKFASWGTVESGYSFFLPTEALKTLQGVEENKLSQFYYLQLILTPTLFKQEQQ